MIDSYNVLIVLLPEGVSVELLGLQIGVQLVSFSIIAIKFIMPQLAVGELLLHAPLTLVVRRYHLVVLWLFG